jgi:hypothetical protein
VTANNLRVHTAADGNFTSADGMNATRVLGHELGALGFRYYIRISGLGGGGEQEALRYQKSKAVGGYLCTNVSFVRGPLASCALFVNWLVL